MGSATAALKRLLGEQSSRPTWRPSKRGLSSSPERWAGPKEQKPCASWITWGTRSKHGAGARTTSEQDACIPRPRKKRPAGRWSRGSLLQADQKKRRHPFTDKLADVDERIRS